MEQVAVANASNASAELQAAELPIQRPNPDRSSETSVTLDGTAIENKLQQKPGEFHCLGIKSVDADDRCSRAKLRQGG